MKIWHRRIGIAIVRGSCPQRDIDDVLMQWPLDFRVGVDLDCADIVLLVGDINHKLLPYVVQDIERRTEKPLLVWLEVRALPVMGSSPADLRDVLAIDVHAAHQAIVAQDVATLAETLRACLKTPRRAVATAISPDSAGAR